VDPVTQLAEGLGESGDIVGICCQQVLCEIPGGPGPDAGEPLEMAEQNADRRRPEIHSVPLIRPHPDDLAADHRPHQLDPGIVVDHSAQVLRGGGDVGAVTVVDDDPELDGLAENVTTGGLEHRTAGRLVGEPRQCRSIAREVQRDHAAVVFDTGRVNGSGETRPLLPELLAERRRTGAGL
jgi:hypothetical protein